MIKENKLGFDFFAAFYYYPKRYQLSKENDTIRRLIWAFKDGELTEMVVKIIKGTLTFTNSSNIWLSIIPASTSHKTSTRFKNFCTLYCQETGIQNGFHLIQNAEDRDAKHMVEDRNSISILNSITFDPDIKGKNILLFDDVYTTGKSFYVVASKLIEIGAISVTGFFLGKTTRPD